MCTNNENNICETVTYPRIKKVMLGYEHDNKKTTGLGGRLTYYKTSFEK
jgi:adenine-specific DNA-methyltransferase